MAQENDENSFRLKVKQFLHELSAQVDEIDSDDFDPMLSDGVLSVSFEDGNTFVLSQQVPVQELWFSAMRRAWHFRCTDSQWLERDTGEDLLELLAGLFSERLGMRIQFQY